MEKNSVSTANNLGGIECNYAISPTTTQINCQNKKISVLIWITKDLLLVARFQGLTIWFSSWFSTFFCSCTDYFSKILGQILQSHMSNTGELTVTWGKVSTNHTYIFMVQETLPASSGLGHLAQGQICILVLILPS